MWYIWLCGIYDIWYIYMFMYIYIYIYVYIYICWYIMHLILKCWSLHPLPQVYPRSSAPSPAAAGSWRRCSLLTSRQRRGAATAWRSTRWWPVGSPSRGRWGPCLRGSPGSPDGFRCWQRAGTLFATVHGWRLWTSRVAQSQIHGNGAFPFLGTTVLEHFGTLELLLGMAPIDLTQQVAKGLRSGNKWCKWCGLSRSLLKCWIT